MEKSLFYDCIEFFYICPHCDKMMFNKMLKIPWVGEIQDNMVVCPKCNYKINIKIEVQEHKEEK